MYQGKFQNDTPVQNPRKRESAPQSSKNVPAKRNRIVGTIVFYSLLLVLIAAFFVGMSFVMKGLNDWLVRFEASQPTAKCEAVFAQLFADPEWKQIYDLSEGEHEISAEDYAQYMTQKIGDNALTYIETSAGLSGDKKYIVRNGSEKVATFTLHNAQPDADIPDWQLDKLEIFYSADHSVTVLAPPDYTVTVNGIALDDSHVLSSVSTKAEEYLPDTVHGYQMNELAFSGLLVEPQVSALDPLGNPVELSYDEEYNIYYVQTQPQEVTDGHRQTLVTAAETYCKYMIGAATKAALRNCFDTRSDIYKTITSNDTWMQNYRGYELEEAQIADYYCYNEEYFSARVSLVMNVTRNDGSVKEYALDNTFFVKKAGDQWQVWEMINSNAQDTVTNVRLTYVSEGEIIHSEMVDAEAGSLTLPAVTAPEGKEFTGWFIETVGENGVTTMELAFQPTEDGTVRLPADSVLEPMTLYALYQ